MTPIRRFAFYRALRHFTGPAFAWRVTFGRRV